MKAEPSTLFTYERVAKNLGYLRPHVRVLKELLANEALTARNRFALELVTWAVIAADDYGYNRERIEFYYLKYEKIGIVPKHYALPGLDEKFSKGLP